MLHKGLGLLFAFMTTLSLTAHGGNTTQQKPYVSKAQSNIQKEAAHVLSKTKKILVVYFSHSGNTREIANQIHTIAGGDVFEIVSVKPYPTDYDACVNQARKELDSGYKPSLKTKVNNINAYDLIFIGYPNWWGTFPRPVFTFFSEYDLSGKAIAPFCTHEGSRLGRSAQDIAKLCPKSKVLEGLAVRGASVKSAQADVTAWLQKLKVIEMK